MTSPLADPSFQKRDTLFDNLKGILILLVVFGHTFEKYIGDAKLPYSMYGTLYTFHMPLFIFISGYFSKNADKARENAFTSLLLPYFIFNSFYFITQSILHHRLEFSIHKPGWTLWYLLSLFTMKFFLKDVVRIKYNVGFFFLVSILIGIISEFNHTLSLSRTICFMPFFLLGYYADANTISKIRSYKILLSMCGGLLLVGAFIFWNNMFNTAHPVALLKMVYLSGPYSIRELSNASGMLMRLSQFLVAILLGSFLIAIAPSQKIKWLAQMGGNTLTIYIVHTYIISVLYNLIPRWDSSLTGTIILCISPILIALFLSLPIFSRWMNRFLSGIQQLFLRQTSS